VSNVVTTIYLLRHGETDWNAAGRCQGTSDIPMNAAGYTQVEALGRALAHVELDAAYTSPLIRTRETARVVLGARTIPVVAAPDLVELSYGDLQGTHSSTWDAEMRDAWDSDPWSVTFPNGESLAMVHARAVPALNRIVNAHAGQTVLVSSHGHLNRVLALHVHKRPAGDFWAVEQDNASSLILSFPLLSTTL
jgi:broad specificity phosphatase PhoE